MFRGYLILLLVKYFEGYAIEGLPEAYNSWGIGNVGSSFYLKVYLIKGETYTVTFEDNQGNVTKINIGQDNRATRRRSLLEHYIKNLAEEVLYG